RSSRRCRGRQTPGCRRRWIPALLLRTGPASPAARRTFRLARTFVLARSGGQQSGLHRGRPGVSVRCVFLDRDGVINEKPAPHDYIRSPDEFRLLPNIADWIRLFNALEFVVIVITNQRGVARGLMTEAALASIHSHMLEELAAKGARIDDVFYCPHEENSCHCRQPKPGLVYAARDKWNIDL